MIISYRHAVQEDVARIITASLKSGLRGVVLV